MACSLCQDGYDFYLHHQRRATELAKNLDQHALLLRCDSCGAFWNVRPEERGSLEELTEDELSAHDARYPVLVTIRCRK